jgi:hypothetical protein
MLPEENSDKLFVIKISKCKGSSFLPPYKMQILCIYCQKATDEK